tara:strand:- start:50533 stop:52338 length:1806 start_codon:yes stop_codon:yes gene_type:complete
MFNLTYKKYRNDSLFREFEDEKIVNLKQTQNYIPLYNTFFSLNDTNWNSINLNNSKHIRNIYSKDETSDNTFTIKMNNNKITKSFFKFSPLIDPIKYMYGKYKEYKDEQIYILPTYDDVIKENTEKIQERMLRKNNVSYVDGFFSYLSSKLKDSHNFINGQEYYGSFLGIKQNFKINILDDIEYLSESGFFYENTGKLFTVDEEYQDLFKSQTRSNKQPLNIIESAEIENDIQNISEVDPSINEIFKTTDVSHNKIVDLHNIDITDKELVFEFDLPVDKETTHETSEILSDCSSRTSTTSKSDGDNSNYSVNDSLDSLDSKNSVDNNESINSGSNSSSSTDTYSTMSEDIINATINKMPVQVICQEKMKETLDDYMNKYDVNDDEWVNIFAQIIFSLLVFKKAFEFTHNDLHTNNIMYIETDEDYIFYKFNKEYYKVKTFGKIWKIIDFGRAIYKFKGKEIISDSYHKNEDAGTQFNFGEYYNNIKPIVRPNFSFDLCRLGCSLFDYFFDSVKDTHECDDNLSKLINEWCQDDNGKNILYKDNDKERYPGFKLYKMITRSVSKHTPENQLKKPVFSNLKCSRRHLKKSNIIVNIDTITSYS